LDNLSLCFTIFYDFSQHQLRDFVKTVECGRFTLANRKDAEPLRISLSLPLVTYQLAGDTTEFNRALSFTIRVASGYSGGS
jgi:hypothetical protein